MNAVPFATDAQPPLFVTTWTGDISVADAVAYFDWLDVEVERARREQRRIALVHDARAVKKTGPDARRALADRSSGDSSDVVTGVWVVVDNVLIRGAMSAIRWINPKMRETHSAKTVAEAVAAARASLATPTKAR